MTRQTAIPLLALIVLGATVVDADALAVLEAPSDGGELSGVLFVAGWKCPPVGEITIVFDDLPPLKTATGVPRGDTADACDNDGNNGFIAQFNYSILNEQDAAATSNQQADLPASRQVHTAIAYDDGVEFARAQFHVTSLGERFLRGVEGSYELQDFPHEGDQVVAKWNQGTQSFVITNYVPFQPAPTPIPAAGCPCFTEDDLPTRQPGAPYPRQDICLMKWTNAQGQWVALPFTFLAFSPSSHALPHLWPFYGAASTGCWIGSPLFFIREEPNNCDDVFLAKMPTCESLGVSTVVQPPNVGIPFP